MRTVTNCILYTSSSHYLKKVLIDPKRSGEKLLSEEEELDLLCRSVLEGDLAMVTVKLGSPTLVTSVRARKTTFAEKLATFGPEREREREIV